jgi:hypothetical protein
MTQSFVVIFSLPEGLMGNVRQVLGAVAGVAGALYAFDAFFNVLRALYEALHGNGSGVIVALAASCLCATAACFLGSKAEELCGGEW